MPTSLRRRLASWAPSLHFIDPISDAKQGAATSLGRPGSKLGSGIRKRLQQLNRKQDDKILAIHRDNHSHEIALVISVGDRFHILDFCAGI
jgi:hypothetical protein